MSTLTCESSVLNMNYFTWNISNPFNDSDLSSFNFYFCGCLCYLSFHFRHFGNSYIILHITKPLKNENSYYCKIDLKYGDNLYTATEKIQISDESKDIKIFEICLKTNIELGCLNFSWSENIFNKISQQDKQTKPERNVTVFEQGTQTEDTQISFNCDICNHSEKKSNKFLEVLSKDLCSFYEGKTDTDCVLRVEEMTFPVHRSVLSARSSVFAAMFHHDTSESQNGEVDILDVDAGVLSDVLYYIYAGKVRRLSPDTAASMYVISDKYALIDLRDECLNFLKNNINMENVCDAALLAHIHAEAELENIVVLFIEDKLEELTQNEKWQNFSDTHLKLARDLFCSACMVSKKKVMK